MVHGLETIKRLNKEAVNAFFWQDFKRVEKEHHSTCYGVQEFEFFWGEADCPGIWAYGGPHKDAPPCLLWAKYLIPKKDKTPGWFCYIGPRPEFSNENPCQKRKDN
jgi:hypothetical protein